MTVDEPAKCRLVGMAAAAGKRERLGLGNRLRRVLEDVTQDALAGRRQLGQGHDLVNETDAERLGGAEALAGQRVATELAHADGVGKLRDDDRRGQAPTRL